MHICDYQQEKKSTRQVINVHQYSYLLFFLIKLYLRASSYLFSFSFSFSFNQENKKKNIKIKTNLVWKKIESEKERPLAKDELGSRIKRSMITIFKGSCLDA